MKFEGYIEPPKGRSLNVLDYLTISNGTLFVTSESSGALFKVNLGPNHPSLSTVSELPESGVAHGVALLMERNVALMTRSEENTVVLFGCLRGYPSRMMRMQYFMSRQRNWYM